MTTKCNTEQLAFQGLGRREVVGRFNGGEISSDGVVCCYGRWSSARTFCAG